jgi:hypothetical protein
MYAYMHCFTDDMSEELIQQLFQALQHLQDLELVHCDIEPKHIGVHATDPNKAGLMDFSLCRRVGAQLSADIKYAGKFRIRAHCCIRC